MADLKMMGMGGVICTVGRVWIFPIFQRNLWNWWYAHEKANQLGMLTGFMMKIAFLPEQQAERLEKLDYRQRYLLFHRKLWRKIQD